MKNRVKIKFQILFRVFIFIVIAVFLFFILQKMVTPVYEYETFENDTYRMKDFYALDENELDVLFLGTSHVRYAISPLEIYGKSEIISYNLGSGGQPVELTYYLLEEAFKTQTPEVVVLDVSGFFEKSDNRDALWRRVLDNMKFGESKIRAAMEYAKQSKEVKTQQERFNSVLFPMLQFHTRWKEIEENNFRPLNVHHTEFVTRGYALSSCVNNGGEGMSTELIDSYVEYDTKNSLHYKEYDNGVEKEIIRDEVLYEQRIREDILIWLNKIKEICDRNNAELLLIKVPENIDHLFYDGAWNYYKSQEVKKLASENNVCFHDLMYDTDLNIDINTDYHDGGAHLNCKGGTKVSEYVAAYLCENYDIEPNKSADIEEDMLVYARMKEMAFIQTENDFSAYCELLKDNNYIVGMAMQGDFRTFLSNANKKALGTLGVATDFENDLEVRNAYVALVCDKKVDYEAFSNRYLYATRNITEELSIVLVSSGNCSNGATEIRVNNENLAKDADGLKVVVLDKETKVLVDTAVFNSDGNKVHDKFLDEWKNLQNYLETVQGEEK